MSLRRSTSVTGPDSVARVALAVAVVVLTVGGARWCGGGSVVVVDDARRGREVDAVADHVERAALALAVDAADVLAEHADAQQLDAAEEQDRDHDRRVAANVLWGSASLETMTQSARQMPTSVAIAPRPEARRSGRSENDVTPSAASFSSLVKG